MEVSGGRVRGRPTLGRMDGVVAIAPLLLFIYRDWDTNAWILKQVYYRHI